MPCFSPFPEGCGRSAAIRPMGGSGPSRTANVFRAAAWTAEARSAARADTTSTASDAYRQTAVSLVPHPVASPFLPLNRQNGTFS